MSQVRPERVVPKVRRPLFVKTLRRKNVMRATPQQRVSRRFPVLSVRFQKVKTQNRRAFISGRKRSDRCVGVGGNADIALVDVKYADEIFLKTDLVLLCFANQ